MAGRARRPEVPAEGAGSPRSRPGRTAPPVGRARAHDGDDDDPDGEATLDTAEFRRVMGHFATGVTVVGTRRPSDDLPCALTANAVASVSLDPMLVLVCVDRSADSHDCLLDSGIFSINILAEDHERYARRFSSWDIERKFEGIAYRTETTGAPVLAGVLGWVDCRVVGTHPGGDHTIVIGEVVAGDADPRVGTPLIYYRSGYARLAL
ncbi:MAG: flavin reductase family protein [Gemmatimonadota bacterium]